MLTSLRRRRADRDAARLHRREVREVAGERLAAAVERLEVAREAKEVIRAIRSELERISVIPPEKGEPGRAGAPGKRGETGPGFDDVKLEGDELLFRRTTGEWVNVGPLPKIKGGKSATYQRAVMLAGGAPQIVPVTGNYTMAARDDIVEMNSASAATVTLLPANAWGNRFRTIKNVGVGICTVAASGTDTIDGLSGLAVQQWDSMTLYANGNAWRVF